MAKIGRKLESSKYSSIFSLSMFYYNLLQHLPGRELHTDSSCITAILLILSNQFRTRAYRGGS